MHVEERAPPQTDRESKPPRQPVNKQYVIVVSILTFVLPLLGWRICHTLKTAPAHLDSFVAWFIFSAVGLRLFIAGIRQVSRPAFTAREIFHIASDEANPIVRELGFANLCFGLVGIIALFRPDWRPVSAFASGIYYGLAGLLHFMKKAPGANEQFALGTDVFIFIVLLVYFLQPLL